MNTPTEYVDGFLLPIAKDKVEAYRQMSATASKVWLEHGALQYRECVGDDLEIKDMVHFPQVIGAKEGETVVFAWIVYRSREHRDEVNAKVMADERLASICGAGDSPFDMKRMAYGGFQTIVQA